uniref:20S-pre-rRNA D-site endonuclease NOB1 n=1 Tax=Candidozyma auris TaxID=498019 RepID=A0A0L0NN73_CANAR
MTDKSVDSLVLDATPLITQSASALQQFASNFFTTPGVRAELKDEHSRNQLLLWGDRLVVRQPKQLSVDRVSSFAKLTGDFSVLSMNDIHIIALAYELEVEKAGKDGLRRYPGEKLTGQEEPEKPKRDYAPKERLEEVEDDDKPQEDDDGFQIVSKKKSRKPRKKWSPKEPEKTKVEEEVKATENTAETVPQERDPAQDSENPNEELAEEYDEDDDDGDWITPDNLKDEILKDNNETVQDNKEVVTIPVALSTGDFACQNTSLQLGLKLMNPHSGKQIKRVRNYMYRCHACFTMTPMSKTGQPKHFCPKCGGNTLLRCAVSVDNETGKVTPHLKRNFQWIVRGQVYSMPSPLSKNQQKNQGNRGYQHNKDLRNRSLEPLILREDQKEYAKALKDDAWLRKKSEKMLQEWIGGGSADNFISPFGTSYKSSGVRVGRGRNANANKSRRK